MARRAQPSAPSMTATTPTSSRTAFSTEGPAPIFDVDGDARVVARAETEVLAPPELVFALIADVASWPRWNADVRAASIDGPFERGTRFRWRAGPATITSTLEHVERPRRIVWTGRSLGIRAIHAYDLIPRGERTLVVTKESWSGALVGLFPTRLRRALESSLYAGLRHLEQEAESSRRRA